MSNPNKRERDMAARFFYYALPAYVDDWVESGVVPTDERFEPDALDLAKLLALYREELTNGR